MIGLWGTQPRPAFKRVFFLEEAYMVSKRVHQELFTTSSRGLWYLRVVAASWLDKWIVDLRAVSRRVKFDPLICGSFGLEDFKC